MCEFCGVNINTASKHLLSYVSGIGEKLAENIVNYVLKMVLLRKATQKNYLVWAKAFQQGAAFIRIKDRKTHWITQLFILKPIQLWKNGQDLKLKVTDLIANKEKTALIKPENYVTQIGLLTLKDIIKRIRKTWFRP
jgi:uncharacterized protein